MSFLLHVMALPAVLCFHFEENLFQMLFSGITGLAAASSSTAPRTVLKLILMHALRERFTVGSTRPS